MTKSVVIALNFVPCKSWVFIVLGWSRLKLNRRLVHFATSLQEVREKGSHEKGM